MSDYLIINNKILPAKYALISAQDRGFRFGDGVFETCLIASGKIYNWKAHKARLEAGLKAIKIDFNSKNLEKSCSDLIKKNKIQDGYLRIAISRGVGSIGYLPAKDIQPTIVIETLKPNPKPKSPIKLMVSSYTKTSLKSLPANYKLMNGLNSTLAKLEAVKNNCFDGIILNEKNQICETSSANIFWIKNDILHTPDLNCGCLAGTIREKILKLSPIKTKLVKAKLDDLINADEAFITNVAIGVLKIDQINKKKFSSKKYSKVFSDLLIKDIQRYA